MMPSIPMQLSKLVELNKNPLQKPRQTTKTRNKREEYMKELVELKQEAQNIGKLVSQLGGSL
jgi:hypothetical protein